MSGTVLAIISDSHVGSSTAIAPLEFNVHSRSENEVQKTSANKLQRWLYECWTDYWDHVFKLAKKKRLIVVHCGDLIDNLHHGSLQRNHFPYNKTSRARYRKFPTRARLCCTNSLFLMLIRIRQGARVR